MYLYETHLHTSPASACAKQSVRKAMEFYKKAGYSGIFVTNHFLDGNTSINSSLDYEQKIKTFFSDYEEGKALSQEIGIDVFCGLEMSYKGTDFLVYGLNEDWWIANPEVMQMKKSVQLPFLMENEALVIHAHPYREAGYIDHIRLFPRCVHGVEIYNANRNDFVNGMAEAYAKAYDLIPFSGSDCHNVDAQKAYGGMAFESPIKDEFDFIERIKNGEGTLLRGL